MLTHLASLQLFLDLIGVFAFALAGGLVGVRNGLDVFGILVLALVTALGGGVFRDLVLSTEVVGVSDWKLVTTALAGGLLTFWSAHRVERFSRPVKVLDAVGLAVFCVSASLKTLALGGTAVTALILGVVTAVGGGMIRDVLVGTVPDVLRRELYAVPALLGSVVVVVGFELHVLDSWLVWLAAAAAFGLRILSLARHWSAPHARLVQPPRATRRRRVLRPSRGRARLLRGATSASAKADEAGRAVADETAEAR